MAGRGLRIGLVVHRYGAGISGGAEFHARLTAGRLRNFGAVEVVTTRARDYLTWANAFPAGESVEDGVLVRRFPTIRPRNLLTFDAVNRAVNLCRGRAPAWLERLWLGWQGPRSPELLAFIGRHGRAYDRLIFYTYLYEPTVLGLGLVPPETAWFVPTAHDEPTLRLRIMRPAFERARSLGFMSPAERDLILGRFGLAGKPAAVLGAAMEPPAEIKQGLFAAKHGLAGDGPGYALYLGRIDTQKGVPELLDFWLNWPERPAGLKLVLAGEVKMNLPPGDGSIVTPGFVSEAEKWSALAGARVVVAPSPFESLNLTLLEAGAVGRPVLVNGRCRVMADYVARSGGGLAYTDHFSFAAGLSRLLHPVAGREYGQANQAWVEKEFSFAAFDTALAGWLELPSPEEDES